MYNSDTQMHTLTHFLTPYVQQSEDYTGLDLFSFSSVCVTHVMSQFVVKSTSAQQDSLFNMRQGLVVFLIISNHAITPIHFQNPLV